MMKEFYVNARFLTQPMSGVQRFAAEVSLEMQRRNLPVRFVSPVNILHHQLSDQLGCELIGRFKGHAWEQFDLPRILRKRGNPLLINLANTGPRKYSHAVITLHDMAFYRHPEWFSKAFSAYYQWLIPALVKRSDHIWTVSEFSAAEIRELFGESGGRISVVGNGIASTMLQANATKLPGMPVKFILGLTGNNRRKNQAALLQAVQSISEEPIPLVLTGTESRNFASSDTLQSASSSGKVIRLPGVNDHALKWLYEHAEVFVYPSFYEGFGLPPLEAMAGACPVILSDIPVFREIYEGAAYFVNPNNPKEIAHGIRKILSEEQYRQQLITAGKKLVEIHTFKKVVDRMITVLEAD